MFAKRKIHPLLNEVKVVLLFFTVSHLDKQKLNAPQVGAEQEITLPDLKYLKFIFK